MKNIIQILEEKIQEQHSLVIQYALRFANTELEEERVKFEKHKYCFDMFEGLKKTIDEVS